MKRAENPIDKDKTTDQPHLLPYAHHVGSAIIRPIDKGKEKGLSMTAMYQQTNTQLTQIKDQVETLIRQAQEIHDRIDISEKIYAADIGFRPLIGKVYHLFVNKDNSWVISMVGPEEWGNSCPYSFLATVTMLADHTWQINEKSEDYYTLIKKD
jgi:hypothetical protein